MREIQVKVLVPEAVYRFSVWILLVYRRIRYGYAFRQVPLTKGKFAIVDPADYPLLSQIRWYAKCCNTTTYAVRDTKDNGKHKKIYMHRLIMKTPSNLVCDHINHNGIDNRKVNMRNCSISQNNANIRPLRNAYSKYKGVTWSNRDKKFTSNICRNGRKSYLGLFNNERDAAKAYDMAAKKMHGEFAFLNFP